LLAGLVSACRFELLQHPAARFRKASLEEMTMARWGLCSGCVLGAVAFGAVGAAMRWLDGATVWLGWVAFALFGWGAVMSVYSFDRPAPSRAPRVR
jgi:hypothetical protein